MKNYFSDDEKVEVNDNNFLVFTVGEEEFAVDIKNVIEIIEMQELTHVPDLPTFIVGMINFRKKFYPITDLRIRFRMETKAYTERTCMILLAYDNMDVGFIVDEIDEVISVKDEEIKDSPNESTGFYNRFIKKVIYKGKDKCIFVLDCSSLFINEEQYILEINSSR